MPKRQKTKKRISKRRKHTIKRVSTIKHIITGGKYIAQGTYGCVFKPQLPCNGNPEIKEGYVSKLIAAFDESEEMKGKTLFGDIDSEMKYFLYPEKSCIPGDAPPENVANCKVKNTNNTKLGENYSTDKRRLIQMEDGGDDLFNLKLSASDYNPFFTSLLNLIEGLELAHKNNITHNDIRAENILSKKNEDGSFTTRFIDFGFSCKTDRFKELPLYFVFLNKIRKYVPFDIIFIVDTYIKCLNNKNKIKCTFGSTFGDLSNGIINYFNYLNGALSENFGYTINAKKYYTDISNAKIAESFPKNYILHNFVYLNNDTLAKIMGFLYAKSTQERYTFVLSRFDIYALGLYLSDVYRQKVGHVWLGLQKNDLHSIYLATKKGNIPLLELKDGAIQRKEYASLSEAYKFIPEEIYNIHTDIALNVSKQYFVLVSEMMHPDILERITLDDAKIKYENILKNIATYFTKDKILQFVHRELAFDQTIEQIINEEAEAAYAKAELQRLLTEYKSKQQEIGVIKQNIQRLLVTKNTIEKNIKTYKAISKSTKNSIDKWPENKETPNRILQLEQLEIKIQEFEEEFNTISQKLDDENSKFTQLEKQINDIVETHNSLLAELNKLMKKK
jgi:serine/threonine protein kinase